MEGALVGGAFLSAFINVVLDRLISPEAANLITGKNLDSKLVERLKIALCAAEALLADAEHKQFHNQLVKNWLHTLNDAVYKVDDLLDHVFTKAATQKEVSASFPRFLNFQDADKVNEMEGVVKRIEDVEKQGHVLGLEKVVRDNNNLSCRAASTSLVKGNIYGRENDQDAIIRKINSNSEQELSVIPIVGMGGVGKTTLAQWVYSNEDLMIGFDVKAWFCFSKRIDVIEVMRVIVGGVTSTCYVDDLKRMLWKRKFFIVLDNVWSDDGDWWNAFKAHFQCGAKGCTILVTTRNEGVAAAVQTCAPYFLSGLSEDHCWSVFANNACFSESNGSSTLEEIGRKIVAKCEGLPLAAETLGCLLRTKHDVKEWSNVLTSDIWEFSVKGSKIIPALLISYYHLPAHLKRCFVYCSMFPKGHKFVKDELILLWMAEDLLRPPKRGETLEEVGCECFDELASRLFFKELRNDEWNDVHGFVMHDVQGFVMHDLLHDLTIFLAGDFYCGLEELGKAKEINIQTRHLSYASLSCPISKNFDSIDKLESLRTFLPINFSPSFNIESAICFTLSKLKYLRSLSFNSYKFEVLPDAVGELFHLRYLDLSESRIKTLPESLCDLYNLQTLKLTNCYRLTRLPRGMHNLVNLRHLDTRGTMLREMAEGLGKLKHLHVLGCYVVGKQEGNGIKELGGLSNLHGKLEIGRLENVANRGEVMEARVMDKTYIDNLSLTWYSSSGVNVSNAQAERDTLDMLQPHDGLKRLSVYGYSGTRFSDWVGHPSYHNMTHVSLVSCRSCCKLPSLGQLPSLKSLLIKDSDVLETIGVEFYKNEDDPSSPGSPFPSLVDLTFVSMSCWEVWTSFDSGAFPQLKSLQIKECPKLKGDLPTYLPALEELEICGCQQLASSLPRAPSIRKMKIVESDKIRVQELPLSLRKISIGGCQPVESMHQAMTISHPTCLEKITILDYPSAASLPWDCLPESLKSLKIQNSTKLQFQNPQQLKQKLVQILLDSSSDSLTSFPLQVFPNLKDLIIKSHQNLESLSMSESQLAALINLDIISCPNFVWFPKNGLAAPNMTSFSLVKCTKLKSLPCHMNIFLPNLESLTIDSCPEIDSFPEGGLPPKLKSFSIGGCKKLLSNLSSMGVHEGLIYLSISSTESVKSFPNEGLLPQLPSVETLDLFGFSNLESLESKELLLRLTSLQKLRVSFCPKLEIIAGEKLPESLRKLVILECRLLAERCEKKDPHIWLKISHIPSIKVGHRWIS